MRRYDYKDSNQHDKHRLQEWKREHTAGGFKCSHCKQFVIINDMMGTANRNHCNWCLWSKHVDEGKGDRRATCHGGMGPIGLTFKHEGFGKTGEIMIIHLCSICQKISINRVARDDPEYKILDIFEASLDMDSALQLRLDEADIYLLTHSDEPEIRVQLYGCC